MILILNLERIVYLDVKCRLLWYIYGWDQNDGQYTQCVGWTQLTLWKAFLKMESKSFIKKIKKFPLRLILWIGLFEASSQSILVWDTEIQITCEKSFTSTRIIYKIKGLKEKEVEN
jgi:hypothetical protein